MIRLIDVGLNRYQIRRGKGRGEPAGNKTGRAEVMLTALLSRYNLQQSMLAPLSRFGSGFVCRGAGCMSMV